MTQKQQAEQNLIDSEALKQIISELPRSNSWGGSTDIVATELSQDLVIPAYTDTQLTVKKVEKGLPLPPTYTKYDIVKVIPSRDTYSNNGFTIHHNLGCFPKFFFLQAGQKLTELNHIQAIIGGAGASQDNANFIYQQGNSYTFESQKQSTYNPIETQLQFNWYSNMIFKAGIEYTLITMA